MSQTTSLTEREVPEGYASRTVTVEGRPMTFTFYMGFASRVTHTPRGGETIVVYEQEGVFHVPGGGAPEAETRFWITGGPDDLDVELDIDDGPLGPPDYRGPIERFEVVTKRSGGGGGGGGRVRAQKGGNQVASIRVQERGRGGVFPHMPDGGGSTGVENTAQCCPPTCG